MRRHARAVIVLSGWLLMRPEIHAVGGTYRIETMKDVREWRQLLAFDTAQRCEQARISSLEAMAKKEAKHPDLAKPLDAATATFESYEEVTEFAARFDRCVPTEAVYPTLPAQK